MDMDTVSEYFPQLLTQLFTKMIEKPSMYLFVFNARRAIFPRAFQKPSGKKNKKTNKQKKPKKTGKIDR